MAALVLAGCGGGDDDQAQSGEAGQASAAQTTSGDDEQSDTAAGATATAGADGKQGAQAAPDSGGESATGGSSSGGGGQKQGSHIAAPKGPREQTPSPQAVQEATVANISLQSPAIVAAGGNPGAIPATYTCDGKGDWPELNWSGVPADSTELALYAMSVQPVEGKLFVDWAVAGLDPSLDGIEAGKLPRGAVVGTNSFGKRGYEICPASGEIYMFALYALPRSLGPHPGFDARDLRKEILDVSGNVGLLPAVYARN